MEYAVFNAKVNVLNGKFGADKVSAEINAAIAKTGIKANLTRLGIEIDEKAYGSLSWFDPTEYELTSDCDDYSDAQEVIMDHVMSVVCKKFGVNFK